LSCALFALMTQALAKPLADDVTPAEPGHAGKPLEVLIHQLREGDIRARQDAAEALGRMGRAAEPAVAELAQAMHNPYLTRPAARGGSIDVWRRNSFRRMPGARVGDYNLDRC